MKERTAKLASPTRLGMQSFRNAWQRLSVALMLVMLTTMTAWANDAVTYIDMDGKTKTVTEYTEVTSAMTADGNGYIDWSTGTYVVKSSVTLDGCIRFRYPAVIDLIVCDGATLTVNGNDDGAFDGTTLNIYAQSNGTGMGVVNVKRHTSCIQLNIAGGKVTLDADGKSYGLYVFDGDACGLTVNGGDVTIQNSNGYQGAIYFAGRGFVTLNGGKLTVTNSYETNNTAIEGRGYNTINFNGGTAVINGKIAFVTNINLNGGNVTVNGEIDKSYAYTVTYDFTRATDSYYINAFSNDIEHTVQVKDGVTFRCNGKNYSGTLTDDDISAISGQTMTPDISNHFSVNDAGTEYTIHTAKGWGLFCDRLAADDGKTFFSGKTVVLANDITVTRMAGGQPFTGTFDGGSHTLTLNYGTADAPVDAQFVAPFVSTSADKSNQPVFRNLTIEGTIYDNYSGSEAHNVGGLIGHLYGDVTIEHCTSNLTITSVGGAGGFVGLCEHTAMFTDCVSSTVITSPGGNNSGFVSWSRASGHAISFEGCIFNGKLLQQNGNGASNGGFIGWTGSNKTVTITNSLCAPAATTSGETMASSNSATFARGWNATTTASNSYYTATLGTAQAKQARSITAGENVTVSHAGVANTYSASGITAYKANSSDVNYTAGIAYAPDGDTPATLYAGSGDVVSLALGHEDRQGYTFNYQASAGTLSGSANPYTLTMADENVIVNLGELSVIDWAKESTGDDADHAYMIYNKDQLDLLAHRVNGTHGETDNGYEGKYFKLGDDIQYDPNVLTIDNDNDGTNDSNYEAIGTSIRCFNGVFDGNHKTISGIRIYKGGNANSDYDQGLFGATLSSASIHDVTLADADITGNWDAGGIVGDNYASISNCHVAADVFIRAVQNEAHWHGGIVGVNKGSVTHCTSSATLTIADGATGCGQYGAIAGVNDLSGTLTDNFAIGATIPAAYANYHGAICGGNRGTLERNYYRACNVAGVADATGKGCYNADVTANNGAVPVFTLSLADGVSTTTEPTITYANTNYYAGTITLSGGLPDSAPEGYTYFYTVNDKAIEDNTFTIKADAIVAVAHNITITITADSDTKTYDGTPLTKNTYTLSTVLDEGDVIESMTFSGTLTDVGTVDNMPSNAVIKHGDEDVTSHYMITYVKGTLTVTKRPVTVTTGSATKAYDGTPLTCSDASITGLADGETVTVTATGSQDGVGYSPNSYTIDWGTVKKTNYSVTENLGTLEVTIAPVTTSYVDASGKSQTLEATPLTGGGATTLAPGWYVVNSTISYTGTVTLDNGEVNIILADGGKMSIGTEQQPVSECGIDGNRNADVSLAIYGQSAGSGHLYIYSEENGIDVDDDYEQNGGCVTISVGDLGIVTEWGDVTLRGGTLSTIGACGIHPQDNVNILGGKCTAKSNRNFVGIYASGSGNITLGWKNADDFIDVSSYALGYGYAVLKVADGQALIDADGNIYTGTLLTGDDDYAAYLALNNLTLTPAVVLADAANNATAISDAATVCTGGKTIAVTLSGRTLYKDGAWNTLCLPFDVELEGSPLDGATAKTVIGTTTSGNDLTINFGNPDSATEPVTVLKAGVPYIIKWDATNTNIVEPVFTGVTVVSSTEADRTVSVLDGDVKFVGYYDALSLDPAGSDDFAANVVPSIYYMTADNTLKHTGVARTLHTCRAYFQFANEAAAARQFILDFGDDATGVAVIDNGKLIMDNEAGAVYDLQGRKVNGRWSMVNGQWSMVNGQLKKGLYIFNGKKIVVK